MLANLALLNFVHAEITLRWTDNSSNETGFRVERSIDGGPFELLATLPANTTQFSDKANKEPGLVVSYRVNAFNKYGESGYTNIASHQAREATSYEKWIAQFLSIKLLSDNPLAPDSYLVHPDLPNLLCYAHGINPFLPDRSLLPQTRAIEVDDRMVRVVDRAIFKRSTGVHFKLLVSTDLIRWTEAASEPKILRENATHRWERIELPDSQEATFYRFEVYLDTPQANSQ